MPQDGRALEMGDADFEIHSFRSHAVPSRAAQWERQRVRTLREYGTEEFDMPITFIQGFPMRSLIDVETQVPGDFLMKSIPFCLIDPVGFVRFSVDENITDVTIYQQGLKPSTAWSFQTSDLDLTAKHYVLISNEVLNSEQQYLHNMQLLPVELDEYDLDNKVLLIFMATHSSFSWGVKLQANSTGRIKTVINLGDLQPFNTTQEVIILTLTNTEGRAAKFLHGNIIFTKSESLEEFFLPIFLESGKAYVSNICGYDDQIKPYIFDLFQEEKVLNTTTIQEPSATSVDVTNISSGSGSKELSLPILITLIISGAFVFIGIFGTMFYVSWRKRQTIKNTEEMDLNAWEKEIEAELEAIEKTVVLPFKTTSS